MDAKVATKKFATVAFANLQEPLRQELLKLLESSSSVVVVGKANGYSDITLLVDTLKPEILIVDLTPLSEEMMLEISQVGEKTKVIAVSGNISSGEVLKALKKGVQAYLKIDSAAAEIMHAIRETSHGRHYLSQPLLEQAIVSYLHKVEPSRSPYDFLTFQERKVLRLVAYGYSRVDIADKLHLSERIVDSVHDSILRKLGGTAFGIYQF